MKVLQVALAFFSSVAANPAYKTDFVPCQPHDIRRDCGTRAEVISGYGDTSGGAIIYGTQCSKFTEPMIFKNRETIEVRRVLVGTCKDVHYIRHYCERDWEGAWMTQGCSAAVSAPVGPKAIQVQDLYKNTHRLVCQNKRNRNMKKCWESSALSLHSKCHCSLVKPCDTNSAVINSY